MTPKEKDALSRQVDPDTRGVNDRPVLPHVSYGTTEEFGNYNERFAKIYWGYDTQDVKVVLFQARAQK